MRRKWPLPLHSGSNWEMKRFWIGLIIIWLVLSACNVLTMLAPTPTPSPTFTPLPSPTPAPTEKPKPARTLPPEPTNTPTALSPTLEPATPAQPTATLSKDQAVLVYYINKNEKGPYGCGEALWYIKTTFPKTGIIPVDATNALRTILSYHSEEIGILYNPGYASNLAVAGVTMDGATIKVALTGTYVKTDDYCDASRLKDQLRVTLKQFPGVQNIVITINGFALADVLARK
jgi:hypothetical protein